MNISLEDYVSGGYLISKFTNTVFANEWARKLSSVNEEDLLPDHILSIGFCEARFAPCFDWAGASDQDYADFGIPKATVQELNAWTNKQFDTEIGYPNIFLRLATAREYISRFIRDTQQIQLLGIGLHRDKLNVLDEIEKLNPGSVGKSGATYAGFADNGFAKAIRINEPPIHGEVLGFDVIGCRDHIDHGWHCANLAKDALEKLNFRPNQFGLIDEKINADQLANYANNKLIYDRIWLSVLVTRHSIQSED
jgi:hypothetical protein